MSNLTIFCPIHGSIELSPLTIKILNSTFSMSAQEKHAWLITKDEENNIDKRERDFTREIIPEEKHGVYEYNRPYYKYMGEGGRIYDSLYKYYRKTSDVGGINL